MSSAEGDAAQRAASGTVASALLQTAEGVSGERPSRAPPAAAPTKAERTTESLPSPPGGGEGRTAAAGAAACVPGLEASALNDKLLLFGEAVASAQRGLQQRLFGEEGTSAQTERRVAETRPSQNNSAACPAESAGSGAAAAAPATTAAVSAQTPAGVGPSALPSAQIVTELLQRSRLAGLLQPPAPQQQPQQQLVASDSASQQQRQRLPSSPQTAAVTTTAVAAAAAAVTGRPAFAALPSVAAAHLAAQIAALPRAATAEDSAQTRALPSTAVAAPPPLSAAPAQQNRQPQQNPHQPPIDGRWRESTAAGAAAAEASGGGAAANGRNYSGVLRALRSFESFCADVRQRGREAFARDRAFVAAASASPSWKAPFGGLSETPRDNRAEAEPAKAEEEGGGEGAALEAVAACEEARREAEASSLKRKSEDEAKPSGAAAAKRRGGTSSGPALTVGLVAESLLPFHAFFLRDLQDLAPVRESEGEEAARSERLARVFESVRCACARANNPLAAAAEEGAAAASLSTAAAASVWSYLSMRGAADALRLAIRAAKAEQQLPPAARWAAGGGASSQAATAAPSGPPTQTTNPPTAPPPTTTASSLVGLGSTGTAQHQGPLSPNSRVSSLEFLASDEESVSAVSNAARQQHGRRVNRAAAAWNGLPGGGGGIHPQQGPQQPPSSANPLPPTQQQQRPPSGLPPTTAAAAQQAPPSTAALQQPPLLTPLGLPAAPAGFAGAARNVRATQPFREPSNAHT